MAEITFLSASLKVRTRGKVEMHLSVFSGLICDGDTNSFMIAISVLSQLFLQFTLFQMVFGKVEEYHESRPVHILYFKFF